jgi:glycosyltransferase involved in cell wall biosynthesis
VRLAALVETPDHVCCRYRLRAFEAGLRRAGHSIVLHARPRRWWDRWRLAPQLAAYDAVLLQRRLPPPWELTRLRRSARRLVFDFDDAVLLRDSYSPKGIDSRRRRVRFAAVVRAADAVVAGNAWLAERARAAGAAAVTVIPTCVESSAYCPADHREVQPGVRLVWVGSSSTLRGLELARDWLEAVGRSVPGVRLKLICDGCLAFAHLPVEPSLWREDTETAEIAAADIGISWLPDDDWSRGKCGLKVLQYMAAGLPVVANPVGVQAQMVEHGESGFHATTPDEWVEAIRKLAGDRALRRRMGAAGRRRVERDFSAAVGLRRWCDLLSQLNATARVVG